MHIHRAFDSIFFWEHCPFLNFEICRKWKILLKQLVSTTPLKLRNKIVWNFVVMKDIMCRYAFIQEMLIWSFWGAIYIPFFVRLPVPHAWNCHSLYTTFLSNVGAWGMWACSHFLSFCLCGVYRPTREFFTYIEMSTLPVKGCKFWPMLGTYGHWAVRVL